MTPLWTTSGPVMPNNQWWSALINTSAAAQSGSGNYFYRLDVEFSDFNPNTDAWSNFKLRTTGHSISAAPGVMTFAAPMQTISDFNIVFPGNNGLNDPDPMGTTTYNGTWPFLFEFANPFGQFEIWNGDLDAGNASGSVVDTDDANTAAAQRPPVALSGSELDEGARGMGLPADNSPIVWRRVGGDISMRLTAPGGSQFEDLNPSGNSEWERWVVGSVLGPLNADVVAPLAALPAGIYTLEVRGLDLTNLTYLYFPQEVFSCQLGNPLGRVSLASRESSISGRLGEDLDRDGTLQAGEPGVANRVVTLEGVESFSGKSVSLRARTDADGRYSFHPLEAGEYDVHLQAVRDGLSLKTPAKRRVELGLDDVRDGENFLFAGRAAAATPNLESLEQNGVNGSATIRSPE
jgi:hypothetical protein